MKAKIQIAIVDDHAIFRDGLALLLNQQPDFVVSWQAGDNQSLLDNVRTNQPDLIIMDYHMPGADTGATLSYLKKRYPSIKTLFLTATTSGVLLQQLIKLNPDGILLKESGGNVLLSAIKTVLGGGQLISDKVQELVMQDSFSLTKREFQVLHLICSGMGKTEIAQSLNLSKGTLAKHRENLMRKMSVNNTVKLINMVNRLGLFEEFAS